MIIVIIRITFIIIVIVTYIYSIIVTSTTITIIIICYTMNTHIISHDIRLRIFFSAGEFPQDGRLTLVPW